MNEVHFYNYVESEHYLTHPHTSKISLMKSQVYIRSPYSKKIFFTALNLSLRSYQILNGLGLWIELKVDMLLKA